MTLASRPILKSSKRALTQLQISRSDLFPVVALCGSCSRRLAQSPPRIAVRPGLRQKAGEILWRVPVETRVAEHLAIAVRLAREDRVARRHLLPEHRMRPPDGRREDKDGRVAR